MSTIKYTRLYISRLLPESQNKLSVPKGAKYMKKEKEYVICNVGAGVYEFKAEEVNQFVNSIIGLYSFENPFGLVLREFL